MINEFPYQIVAFLEQIPSIGEHVYNGTNGWYPQIALKRRFKVQGISEDQLIVRLNEFSSLSSPLTIKAEGYAKPARMPVGLLEVEESSELMEFHTDLIKYLGENIISRYPERDGDNYLPHITADYDGKRVIDIEKLKNKNFNLTKVWLLKDEVGGDSIAFKDFKLGS